MPKHFLWNNEIVAIEAVTHCCVGEVSVCLEVAQGAVLNTTQNWNYLCSSLSSSAWLQMLLLFVMLFVTFMNQKIIMVGILKAQEGMKRQHFGVFRESGIEETALTLVRFYGVSHLFSEVPPFWRELWRPFTESCNGAVLLANADTEIWSGGADMH